MKRSDPLARIDAIPEGVTLRCALTRHELCKTCKCPCHEPQQRLPIEEHHNAD